MSTSNLVIYDTDMGTDDAWALFMLLKAEQKYNLKIMGVTLVQGNTSLENVAVNALRVLSSADRLDVCHKLFRKMIRKMISIHLM